MLQTLEHKKYMTTTAMTQLWAYLESLGLSTKNRKWLADKLVEPTKKDALEKVSTRSLRNAFSGDWNNGQDSVSYAKMLREECIEDNRDVASW